MISRLLLGLLLCLTFSASALAGENWLFLGADFGYLKSSSSNPLEVSKNGVEGGIKIVGSHYFDHFVLDLGGGYAYSYISGEGLGATKNIQVITRSFYGEFSPRYRFNERWQLGPVLQILTGGDVSYDENAAVQELSTLWRLGGRVSYEVGENTRWRFGVQAFTDLNIETRNLLGVQLDIQFGFSPGRAPATARVEPVAEATPAPITKPEFAEVKGENIRLYLGEDLLRFKTARFELNAKSQKALRSLVPILLKHEDAWTSLRVEGHTDIRNHKGQNQKLSEDRAEAVKKILVDEKIPETKITTIGHSARQPIDPAETDAAFALNRRVEIWLEHVVPSKSEAFMTDLKKFQK